jgi:hypothetical protein
MKKIVLALAVSLLSVQGFADILRGNFQVSARDPFGCTSTFINQFSNPITVNFSSTGTWSYFPGRTVTGDGDSSELCYLYGNCPVSWAPAGGLVLGRTGGNYQWVGSSQDVDLAPGEAVIFLINDAGTGFGDNAGTLNIAYYCVNGCE